MEKSKWIEKINCLQPVRGFVLLAKNRRAFGIITTVLGTVMVAAVIVFPLAIWQMSLNSNVSNTTNQLSDVAYKLEALSVLEDRWQQINDMNIDEITLARDTTTDYGKYKIEETYSNGIGIYQSNGTCSGTYTDDGNNRACRNVSLTAKDIEGNIIASFGPAIRVDSSVKTKHDTATLTVSQTFVAPFSGTYHIMAIGGGGGGGGGGCDEEYAAMSGEMNITGGGAGGAGGRYIGLHYLSKGEAVKITIGKGGTGGRACNQQLPYPGYHCYSNSATQGENTIVEIKGKQYIGGGGYPGTGHFAGGAGGDGGVGTINGRPGDNGAGWDHNGSSSAFGGNGGNYYGDGGTGGTGVQYGKTCSAQPGSNGHNGVVIISY